MDLKEELMNEAALAKGCIAGMEQLEHSKDKSEMLQCFLDRIDFCLAKNFPNKEFLKANFPNELHEKGIFIDEKVERYNRGMVMLGKCSGVLVADGYAVCRIYVKHDSKLVVKASENAVVMVDALDEADIEVFCRDEAKVIVNLYARAKVSAEEGKERTRIIHKKKETYDL